MRKMVGRKQVRLFRPPRLPVSRAMTAICPACDAGGVWKTRETVLRRFIGRYRGEYAGEKQLQTDGNMRSLPEQEPTRS
jgi:hypothetical protein